MWRHIAAYSFTRASNRSDGLKLSAQLFGSSSGFQSVAAKPSRLCTHPDENAVARYQAVKCQEAMACSWIIGAAVNRQKYVDLFLRQIKIVVHRIEWSKSMR